MIVMQSLEAALTNLAAEDDVVYSLAYIPERIGIKKRKIKIKVDMKGYEVIYDNRLLSTLDIFEKD